MTDESKTPIALKLLQELLGFGDATMSGVSLLLDAPNGGHPVELWICHRYGSDDEFEASLLQSNNDDHVVITGRTFRTVEDVRRFVVELGGAMKASE